MSKTVFITEKPSVAREYARILGVHGSGNGCIEGHSSYLDKDVVITWAVGHLIALGSPDEQEFHKMVAVKDERKWKEVPLPILPQGQWFYKPIYAVKDQLAVIKGIYKSPDVTEIYYAGDSGREGIYIQALIRNYIFGDGNIESARVPSTITERVVWIDSQTEDEIKRGIREAKPYHDYDNMIAAGYERAKNDFLMGMNFSRAYTLTSKTFINTGRVMAPTLGMIVRRQREIDNFVPTPFFGIKATLEGHEAVWKADKTSKFFESPLLYNETGFLKKEDAEGLRQTFIPDPSLLVEDVKVTEKKEYAPQLFNLTELQAECSKKFHISPNDTLALAQSLYEKKYTTYPRTDARVLTTSVANEYRRKGYNVPNMTKYVDDSKVTDHYAVVPTFSHEATASLTEAEQAVYDLVKNRFIAITMAPYTYDSIKVSYRHSTGEPFNEDGKIDKDLGWKALYTQEMVTFTPPVKGQRVNVLDYPLTESQTKPPAAYTTGTLTLAMEGAGKLIEDEELREQIKTCGIGTPATRAGIIEKLAYKGTKEKPKTPFITVDKKQKITPTEFGMQCVTIMETIDATFLDPEKTASMEKELNDIAAGTLTAVTSHAQTENYIRETITKINGNEILKQTPPINRGTNNSYSSPSSDSGASYCCPFCQGSIVKGLYGYYCKDGKDFKSMGGHQFSEDDVKDLLEKGITKAYKLKFQSGKEAKAKFVLDMDTKQIKLDYVNERGR